MVLDVLCVVVGESPLGGCRAASPSMGRRGGGGGGRWGPRGPGPAVPSGGSGLGAPRSTCDAPTGKRSAFAPPPQDGAIRSGEAVRSVRSPPPPPPRRGDPENRPTGPLRPRATAGGPGHGDGDG